MFFRIALPCPPAHRPAMRPGGVSGLFAKKTPPHPPKPSFTIALHGRLQRSSTFARYVNYRGRIVAARISGVHLVKTLSVVVVLLLGVASRSSGQIRGLGFVQGT